LEAVGEVNVLTTDFSAEYAGVANIRVSTKRGGSQYHGSIFYNNSNSALAAWTLDDKDAKANFAPTAFQSEYPNPYFNINDLGASLGGPVPKMGKTWFMMAYERNYNIAPVKVSSSSIMHPSLYAGDFTGLKDSPKPVVPSAVTLTPREIGELAKQAGLNPSAIRYYEKMGVLSSPYRANGQRRYSSEALDRVLLARFASDMGFSLPEIKLFLSGLRAGVPVGPRWKKLTRRKMVAVEETLTKIRSLKSLLEHLRRCRCGSLRVCVERLSLSPNLKLISKRRS